MGTSAHAFGRATERHWWTCPLGARMKLRVGSGGSSFTVHKRRSWCVGEVSEERLDPLGLWGGDEELVVGDSGGYVIGTAWGAHGVAAVGPG
mgnify:CR=1 FL=1